MRDLKIVLVRPRNPVNIGAAARAMANFGFDDLAIVSPHPPVWEEVRRGGPGSDSVLDRAKVVATIAEAAEGCSRIAGTTSASARDRDRPPVEPARFRWRGKLALLFGPEKTGLTNQDLSYCRDLVRIPTLPDAPSMNLGQAVAVICYEWSRGHRRPATPPVKADLADAATLLRMLELSEPVLEAAGFFDARTRRARIAKLRRLAMRQDLTMEEARMLIAALHRVSRIVGKG